VTVAAGLRSQPLARESRQGSVWKEETLPALPLRALMADQQATADGTVSALIISKNGF